MKLNISWSAVEKLATAKMYDRTGYIDAINDLLRTAQNIAEGVSFIASHEDFSKQEIMLPNHIEAMSKASADNIQTALVLLQSWYEETHGLPTMAPKQEIP
jgi:hypothetical protein